jgi:hypothetical protein
MACEVEDCSPSDGLNGRACTRFFQPGCIRNYIFKCFFKVVGSLVMLMNVNQTLVLGNFVHIDQENRTSLSAVVRAICVI